MLSFKFGRRLKQPLVRTSTASALSGSATAPASGFTFVENSQGASAAVAELVKSLDFAIEMFDFDGELPDQLSLLLERLNGEATKYRNSRLRDEAGQVYDL